MAERIKFVYNWSSARNEAVYAVIARLGFYDDGVSLREIAFILGITKSTAHRHVNSLREQGRVCQCHGGHRTTRAIAGQRNAA